MIAVNWPRSKSTSTPSSATTSGVALAVDLREVDGPGGHRRSLVVLSVVRGELDTSCSLESVIGTPPTVGAQVTAAQSFPVEIGVTSGTLSGRP